MRKIMPNGANARNVYHPIFPSISDDAAGDAVSESTDPTFWQRWLWMPLGVYVDMANPTPNGEIRLNTQKVMAFIAILGFIAGGFWWTWQRAESAGDARGYQRRQMEEIEEKNRLQTEEINRLKAAAGLLPKEK